jgi:hypothetical protein
LSVLTSNFHLMFKNQLKKDFLSFSLSLSLSLSMSLSLSLSGFHQQWLDSNLLP